MTNEVAKTLSDTMDELMKLLESFSPEELNIVPFEGSWTAGQLAEHLHKSYGVSQILYGPVKLTERRSDEKVELIRKDLLNFNAKFSAAEFIVPANKNYNKESVLNSLNKPINKMKEAANSLNLSETCTAFALPVYGELTRLEWLYFAICHTQRHIYQLKNIAQKIRGSYQRDIMKYQQLKY
jgi:hypothetical protein